jgi:hypothetical protein
MTEKNLWQEENIFAETKCERRTFRQKKNDGS